MVKIIDTKTLNSDKFNEISNHLRKGGVLIYPTDTCYGVGVDLSNKLAIKKINLLKNRSGEKHYSALVPSINWIKKFLVVDNHQLKVLNKYLPGEFTFILKIKKSSSTLGVRIPCNEYCQTIVKKLNRPIISTSANISGGDNPYCLADLQNGILKRSQLIDSNIIIIYAGELSKNRISTIVNLTAKPYSILRQGSGVFNISDLVLYS